MNPYEDAARLRKATAIADVLDAAGIADPDSIDTAARDEAVRRAGIRPPSPETWAAAAKILRQRLAVRAAMPDDPFDGLI